MRKPGVATGPVPDNGTSWQVAGPLSHPTPAVQNFAGTSARLAGHSWDDPTKRRCGMSPGQKEKENAQSNSSKICTCTGQSLQFSCAGSPMYALITGQKGGWKSHRTLVWPENLLFPQKKLSQVPKKILFLAGVASQPHKKSGRGFPGFSTSTGTSPVYVPASRDRTKAAWIPARWYHEDKP